MYRSILVPLDGSLPSEQSLLYTTALARRSGAALQLAYVHTPLRLGEGTMYLGTPDVELWNEEKKYLLSIVDRLKKAGLEKVSAHVLEGPIAETLQEHALGEGSDLIVMTTHGRGPVSRFWLGSVADQLVHRVPMPLLLIRTREEVPPPVGEPEVRNILVALDGTPTGEQILQPAGVLVKLMGASCTLLRVVPSVVPHVVYTEAAVSATVAEKLRAEAHVYLQRVADSLHDQGFAVQTRIIAHAYPATAILNEAASGEYDLPARHPWHRRAGQAQGMPARTRSAHADRPQPDSDRQPLP